MSDDCVELVRVKDEPINIECPEISDDESSSEDNHHNYLQQMNGVAEREQEEVVIKSEILSDEEETGNEVQLTPEPMKLPVISNVHSIRREGCTPQPQKLTSVSVQESVSVKTEPVDEGVSAKRRVSRSLIFDSEKPSTSAIKKNSVKKVKFFEDDDSNHRVSRDKSSELAAIHKLLATIQKPVDEDQIFGEHVACELRAIQDPFIKRRCKLAISQAILNAMQEDSLSLPHSKKFK